MMINIDKKIINRHGTAEYWREHGDFIPDQGELIVYDIDGE